MPEIKTIDEAIELLQEYKTKLGGDALIHISTPMNGIHGGLWSRSIKTKVTEVTTKDGLKLQTLML